jgi:NAD(P)-dependent dehydrogenase (short-subunit alcohol dehydrogenase family)
MGWITDRRVVITGGSSGIGSAVARGLASQGALVVLACRDRERGEAAAAAINTETGSTCVSVMAVDTSDPRSIREFAARYGDAYGSLDVLVNNAGVLLPERETTADGVERTFATNVLGYVVTADALLEALRNAGSGRIVNVASTFASAPDLDDLQFDRRPYEGMSAYAQSKACARMLTWALARRLEGGPVTCNAMAPGLVLETGLYRHLSPGARNELARYGTRSLADGAESAIWLAGDRDVEGISGRFFEQRNELPCEFRDDEAEERLWQICEGLS